MGRQGFADLEGYPTRKASEGGTMVPENHRSNYARSTPRSALRRGFSAMAALSALALPVEAPAYSPLDASNKVQLQLAQQSGGEIYTFYAARNYNPLWLDSHGAPTQAARTLIGFLESAELDGINPISNLAEVRSALNESRSSASVAEASRADIALSAAFVAYVRALLSGGSSSIIYEHDSLRPQMLHPFYILQAAASARSLEDYVSQMKWMHPLYAPLRRGLASLPQSDVWVRQATMNTLARIRGIPNSDRQIIVDVANAKLWMYENGQPVDSMRVVVGKPSDQTPFLAGYVRYAILNPYWNVPPGIVQKTIAPNVLRRGVSYLKDTGYQVLSDWSDSPTVLDPATVNWNAAARGELDLHVRQLPRPGNAMGGVKFEFPNAYGIYLHDTPEKALMEKDARQFSHGCIRLEDAQRLGRWLMGSQLQRETGSAEVKLDLPHPVPIYLTYLTAVPSEGHITMGPDPYGLDQAKRPAMALGQDGATALAR